MNEPDAEPEQEHSGDRARHELGARDAQRAPAPGENRCEQQPGHEEARPGGKERRDRLDRDLDPEVGRPPDDVDDEEGDPDVSDGSGHERENAGGAIGVRTPSVPAALRLGHSTLLLEWTALANTDTLGVRHGV